jgi:NADPH:quinone reductase-like Zn-dependent oxidoreductase
MSGAYSEVGKIDALGDGVTGLQLGEVVWGAWCHRSHAVLPAERLLGHVLPPSLDPMVGKTDTPGGKPT